MNREDRLHYCRYCKKRAYSIEQGIICSISNEPASFDINCPLYDEDLKKKEEDEHMKRLRKSRLNLSPKEVIKELIIGIIIVVIFLFIKFSRFLF